MCSHPVMSLHLSIQQGIRTLRRGRFFVGLFLSDEDQQAMAYTANGETAVKCRLATGSSRRVRDPESGGQ